MLYIEYISIKKNTSVNAEKTHLVYEWTLVSKWKNIKYS